MTASMAELALPPRRLRWPGGTSPAEYTPATTGRGAALSRGRGAALSRGRGAALPQPLRAIIAHPRHPACPSLHISAHPCTSLPIPATLPSCTNVASCFSMSLASWRCSAACSHGRARHHRSSVIIREHANWMAPWAHQDRASRKGTWRGYQTRRSAAKAHRTMWAEGQCKGAKQDILYQDVPLCAMKCHNVS